MERVKTPARSDEWIPTRQSLLTRLKHWDDQEGWHDFFDTYGDVPGAVENAVGGLAAKRTSLAVKSTNQTHQTHERTEPPFTGRSQHQIV